MCNMSVITSMVLLLLMSVHADAGSTDLLKLLTRINNYRYNKLLGSYIGMLTRQSHTPGMTEYNYLNQARLSLERNRRLQDRRHALLLDRLNTRQARLDRRTQQDRSFLEEVYGQGVPQGRGSQSAQGLLSLLRDRESQKLQQSQGLLLDIHNEGLQMGRDLLQDKEGQRLRKSKNSQGLFKVNGDLHRGRDIEGLPSLSGDTELPAPVTTAGPPSGLATLPPSSPRAGLPAVLPTVGSRTAGSPGVPPAIPEAKRGPAVWEEFDDDIEKESRRLAKSLAPHKGTKYVPVVVNQKKKKEKIVEVSHGKYVAGGVQVFGKFTSLKSCMKACGGTPTCFAGDYDKWAGKCFFHTNLTACEDQSSHSKVVHFKKISCRIRDAPRGRIFLGSQLYGGTLQKGVDDITSCTTKCAQAGRGISLTPTALANQAILGNEQICFGVNYDFASHKCYFITSNFPRLLDLARAQFAICPIAAGEDIKVPVDLIPNPTVITVLLCPDSDDDPDDGGTDSGTNSSNKTG